MSAPITLESSRFSQDRLPLAPLFPAADRGDRPGVPDAAPAHGPEQASVDVRLSPEARAAMAQMRGDDESPQPGAFGHALERALRRLGREAEDFLTLVGMEPEKARQASEALTAAVRAGTETPDFRAAVERMLVADRPERAEDGFFYRAALIVEEASIVWDPESGRFVAGVQRVALSLEVESGRLVPRGTRQDLDANGVGMSVIRLDAVVPLDPAGEAPAQAAPESDRPDRGAAGPRR